MWQSQPSLIFTILFNLINLLCALSSPYLSLSSSIPTRQQQPSFLLCTFLFFICLTLKIFWLLRCQRTDSSYSLKTVCKCGWCFAESWNLQSIASLWNHLWFMMMVAESLLHLFSNWSFNNVSHKLVFVCLWTPWKTIIYLVVNINFRSHLQITVWRCSVVNSLI